MSRYPDRRSEPERRPQRPQDEPEPRRPAEKPEPKAEPKEPERRPERRDEPDKPDPRRRRPTGRTGEEHTTDPGNPISNETGEYIDLDAVVVP